VVKASVEELIGVKKDKITDWEDVQISMKRWNGGATGVVADHAKAFGLGHL